MNHITTITDLNGELLRCEFSAWQPTPEGTWTGKLPPAEITLRKVTLPNGEEFVSAADHVKLLTRDKTYRLGWYHIEMKCQQSYDGFGLTTSAVQPVTDRSEEL